MMALEFASHAVTFAFGVGCGSLLTLVIAARVIISNRRARSERRE